MIVIDWLVLIWQWGRWNKGNACFECQGRRNRLALSLGRRDKYSWEIRMCYGQITLWFCFLFTKILDCMNRLKVILNPFRIFNVFIRLFFFQKLIPDKIWHLLLKLIKSYKFLLFYDFFYWKLTKNNWKKITNFSSILAFCSIHKGSKSSQFI